MTPHVLVFSACLAFWLLLSGHFGALEIALGVLAAVAVTWINRDLRSLGGFLRRAPAFVTYVPWLLWEVVVANVQVVRVVLDPRLPIDPVVARFECRLVDDLAVTTLGNSITLTPGTITLDVEGRDVVIHSLLGAQSTGACEGPMTDRVARLFEGRARV